MANKKNKKGAAPAPAKSIGFSTKGNRAPTPTKKPEKEKLTKKQIIILVSVFLLAVMVSGIIIGVVIAVKRGEDPDFLRDDLSKYVTISKEDYSGYDIDIPLDVYNDSYLIRRINMLRCQHKTVNGEVGKQFVKSEPLSLGDEAYIYYRGYTVDENGREKDFDGSSNFSEESETVLEVGTGTVIDEEEVKGQFIDGFGEGLVGIIPRDHAQFEKINSGRVMPGDVIYLSYTVIGESGNKTVTNERIDLGLDYIDELYGAGFTEFFVGKVENGETTGFKTVGEEIKSQIFRKNGESTDTVYSDMKIEFLTRCEESPVTLSLRFPADYHEESLRGTEVKFDVYVKYAVLYDAPEYDDKLVTEKLKVKEEDVKDYAGATVSEKYKNKLLEDIKEEIEESNNGVLIEKMWERLFDRVEVIKLPEKTYARYYNEYYDEIDYGYSLALKQNSSVKLDSYAVGYINYYYGAGLSETDDWKEYISLRAQRDLVRDLIFYYIIREENLLPSEAEFNEMRESMYNDILASVIKNSEAELSLLQGEAYEKKLEELKKNVDAVYDDEYYKKNIYYDYGTKKMLGLVNIIK